MGHYNFLLTGLLTGLKDQYENRDTYNWRRRPNTVFNSLIYSYLICRNRVHCSWILTLPYSHFLKSNQHVYMIARKNIPTIDMIGSHYFVYGITYFGISNDNKVLKLFRVNQTFVLKAQCNGKKENIRFYRLMGGTEVSHFMFKNNMYSSHLCLN